MPRRPQSQQEPTARGNAAPSTSDTCETDVEPHVPDLDERERSQSSQRKAAGPGQPTRAAPLTSESADAPIDPMGTDPCSMPPVDPS